MLKYVLAFLLLNFNPHLSFANPTNSLAAIAEQASKSVVFIAVESNPFDLSYGQGELGAYEYLRPLYNYFWPSDYAHGSGFIISPDGYIVTNSHVVFDATKVLVVHHSADLKIYKGHVVGKDYRTDLAVVKIDDPIDDPLPVLSFGDSDQVQVGQPIICIGNPAFSALHSTVSMGIVSGIDRNNFGDDIEGYIQTDAAVNHGNSGGPVLNAEGQVIGVCTWKMSFLYEGLAFAVPSRTAKAIANQLIDHGKPVQGFLGVLLNTTVESAFNRYKFDRSTGTCIDEIIPDSPAEKAGLKSGDKILKLDHYPIRSAFSLRNRIAILEPGTSVHITFEREEKTLEVSLNLDDEEQSDYYSRLVGSYLVI